VLKNNLNAMKEKVESIIYASEDDGLDVNTKKTNVIVLYLRLTFRELIIVEFLPGHVFIHFASLSSISLSSL
jgi:hypothetical protein